MMDLYGQSRTWPIRCDRLPSCANLTCSIVRWWPLAIRVEDHNSSIQLTDPCFSCPLWSISVCRDEEVMCDDECHHRSIICDGVADCLDGRDEFDCKLPGNNRSLPIFELAVSVSSLARCDYQSASFCFCYNRIFYFFFIFCFVFNGNATKLTMWFKRIERKRKASCEMERVSCVDHLVVTGRRAYWPSTPDPESSFWFSHPRQGSVARGHRNNALINEPAIQVDSAECEWEEII